ncbi:hypothetical protein AVEN_119074-1 [Araneus ventricosus]|uniref:Uncharacterized protein n=1 Tax=Araneus ventricosus TaxID=182803 RepID=A0A4Y2BNA6_ARAVE|nr:hypothetical protein AVEN_119074-1 [Araneus ventricosus]
MRSLTTREWGDSFYYLRYKRDPPLSVRPVSAPLNIAVNGHDPLHQSLNLISGGIERQPHSFESFMEWGVDVRGRFFDGNVSTEVVRVHMWGGRCSAISQMGLCGVVYANKGFSSYRFLPAFVGFSKVLVTNYFVLFSITNEKQLNID